MLKKILNKYNSIPDQVKASIWFVICGILQKAITLLTTPIFSRLLTTSEFGVISVFNTLQNIVIIFASLNLASGVYLRGLIKFKENSDEFTVSLHSLYIINFIIVFFIYIIFNNFWNGIFKLSTFYMCLMFLDILVQVSFHFWSARQRVKYKYRMLVIITLINALCKPIMGVIAVINSQDKVKARIITIVLADFSIFGYFLLKIVFKKGKVISTKYWKYSLAYNLPLIPHYLSQLILGQSDRLMINSIINSSKAGIYSLANSAAVILTIVNQSILNSYNPWMYQKIQGNDYKDIAKVSYKILIFIASINLLLIACAPEVISIMAPSSYYEAIWVIPPVSMSVYFTFLYSLFANFEFYYEKTNYMMIASVVGAIMNIILNGIFIPIFGFIAAGYTTLVCYICYCLFHYILMKKILQKELPNIQIYDVKILALISIIFIILGAGITVFYQYTNIRYLILLIVVAIIIVNREKVYTIIKGFH